jgi:hypothetical protein
VDIRKQAIKDLPTLCRDNKANLPKITDVLTQVSTRASSRRMVTFPFSAILPGLPI